MQIHIALYRWKAGVADSQITAALKAIEALASQIPGIVEISTAVNTSKYNEGFTHVIMVRGQNQAALAAYRNHPLHEVAVKTIEEMEEQGIGVDFSTD